MSHFYSVNKESTSKKKQEPAPPTQYLTQMALFAAIGDRFISKILRQVASDYNLDFEEMKARYCGESSFELSAPVKPKVPKVQVQGPNVLEVDLEALPAPVKVPKPKAPAKPKAPKVPKVVPTPGDTEPEPEKLMALSKMKKPELVAECDSRGLDSEGTVAQLKDRVKDARESDPAAATKGKGKTKPKAPKKVPPPPPPPIVPLEEEGDTDKEEECDPDKEDPEEDEFEVEAEEDDLQARLRKILAEAEEEEFEEEEEIEEA